MTEKYGTNISGLTAFEGDVSTDGGASLIDTDSDGATALLFGPAAIREIQAGVANGDFAIPPDDADSDITDENPLPYFSITDTSSGAITAAVKDDVSAGSGNVLRFTVPGGTTTSKSLAISRFVPVPATRNQAFLFVPEAFCVTSTSTANARVTLAYQFYQLDQTTTTGTGDSTFETFTTINPKSTIRFTANQLRFNAPPDAAFIQITLTVATTATVVSTSTVDICELRLITGSSDLFVAERTAPTTTQGARIVQESGVLKLTPAYGGSGSITLDAATTTSSLTVSGTAGTASVTLNNGNFLAENGLFRGERTAAGSAVFTGALDTDTGDRFRIEAGGTIEFGDGTTGSGDVNLYRSSSTTLKTDDSFAADILSSTLSVSAGNGNFLADGPTTRDVTPTTSGRGAIWTSIGDAVYRLERYVAASTEEVKKNIAPTTVAAEQLYALELVDFEYDQEKIEALRETYPALPDAVPGVRRGVVWEQVVEAMPHAAIPANAGDPPSIDWEALYFAALVAIQDLNQRLAALEAE